MNDKIIKISCLILLVTLISIGCGKEDPTAPENPSDTFARKDLLTQLADKLILPSMESYRLSLLQLSENEAVFAQESNFGSLNDLRESFINAYENWQSVSMFEIGPGEVNNLRNFTNIYPTDKTAIDNNINTGVFNLELPSTFAQQGFPALDYMLYGVGETNDEIITFFNSNTVAKKYLTALVTRLIDNVEKTINGWDDGYREEFIDNDGNSANASLDRIVNDYINYYERFLRAGKVGIPAGVFSPQPLPENVEGLYSTVYSKRLFLAGLDASIRFFNGVDFTTNNDGLGLDDYLDYLQELRNLDTDLNTIINDQFSVIKSTSQTVDENFKSQVETDNSAMLSLYDALQLNVVYLKTDMLQAMNISVDFVDIDGD